MRILALGIVLFTAFCATANAQAVDYHRLFGVKEYAASNSIPTEYRDVRCVNESWTSDRRARCRKDFDDLIGRLQREKALMGVAMYAITFKAGDNARTTVDLGRIVDEFNVSDAETVRLFEKLSTDYPAPAAKK